MNPKLSQRMVQICLFLVAAISISGGLLQFYLGQPETNPRLDNIHRFMAGVYLGSGILALWVAISVKQHSTIIYFLALNILLGGIGRLVSIFQVGIPLPENVWIGYLVPELVIPIILVFAQYQRSKI